MGDSFTKGRLAVTCSGGRRLPRQRPARSDMPGGGDCHAKDRLAVTYWVGGGCSAKGRHEGEARVWRRLPRQKPARSDMPGGGDCLLSAPRQTGRAVLRDRRRPARSDMLWGEETATPKTGSQ